MEPRGKEIRSEQPAAEAKNADIAAAEAKNTDMHCKLDCTTKAQTTTLHGDSGSS